MELYGSALLAWQLAVDARTRMEVPRTVTNTLRKIAAALLALSAVAAAPAGGPIDTSGTPLPDDLLGVNAHVIWDGSPQEQVDQIAASGISWIRADFDWGLLEPSRGRYDWSWSDNLMAATSRDGIDVLAIIDYSAPWASSDPSGGGDIHYPPSDPADFARFSAAVAQRYGTGGDFWRQNPGITARPLTAMEIWNEPFGHWFWKPEPDLTAYLGLVRATIAAVDRVQPNMRILIAGDALEYRNDGQVPWLERLLEEDPEIPSLIDAWAIHPYPDPPGLPAWYSPKDPRYGVRGAVEETIRISEAAQTGLPIWITEVGWCTAGGACGDVDEQQQTEYLLDVLASAVTMWDSTVEKVFVYSFDRSTGIAGDREGNYGLRRSDGSAKPAWEALTALGHGGTLPCPVFEDGPAPGDGVAPDSKHTLGLVDIASGQWRLMDSLSGRQVDRFYFGNPGDVPFMGDWDGDGIETPGLYRQSDGYVYLRNSNTQGIADIRFFFGNPGDIPLAGDFNGDGLDTVSIYRPSNQTFYIINKLGSNDRGLGAAEFEYVFGNPGDKPFVGDFDGDGVETVGLHRESTGLVYFRNSHTRGIADIQFIFGNPGDRLVAGDWTGDGVFTAGLFRPTNFRVYLKSTNSTGIADRSICTASGVNQIPVAGRTSP